MIICVGRVFLLRGIEVAEVLCSLRVVGVRHLGDVHAPFLGAGHVGKIHEPALEGIAGFARTDFNLLRRHAIFRGIHIALRPGTEDSAIDAGGGNIHIFAGVSQQLVEGSHFLAVFEKNHQQHGVQDAGADSFVESPDKHGVKRLRVTAQHAAEDPGGVESQLVGVDQLPEMAAPFKFRLPGEIQGGKGKKRSDRGDCQGKPRGKRADQPDERLELKIHAGDHEIDKEGEKRPEGEKFQQTSGDAEQSFFPQQGGEGIEQQHEGREGGSQQTNHAVGKSDGFDAGKDGGSDEAHRQQDIGAEKHIGAKCAAESARFNQRHAEGAKAVRRTENSRHQHRRLAQESPHPVRRSDDIAVIVLHG